MRKIEGETLLVPMKEVQVIFESVKLMRKLPRFKNVGHQSAVLFLRGEAFS